jgi:hypothetical protein
MPVDRAAELDRVRHRRQTGPHETFPMTEQELDAWRGQFEIPDAAELSGADVPHPPSGFASWSAWAAERWPSLDRLSSAPCVKGSAAGQAYVTARRRRAAWW